MTIDGTCRRPDPGWPGSLSTGQDVVVDGGQDGGAVMAVVTRGSRRIDKVLAEDYLDGLEALALADVRSLRDEARQEETDLSYVRRMLQGRIDIALAERSRRGASGSKGANDATPLVDDLPKILGEHHRGPARGMGRHQSVEPSNMGSTRRAEEQMAAVDLTDLEARSDEALDALLAELATAEAEVSQRRRLVQDVVDATSNEIARRYRDGSAAVGDLLREEGA